MKYTLSIIAIIVGCLLVIKTEWFVRNFGYIGEAEGSFRSFGGTRTVIKLIGIAAIVIAFLVITGMIQSVLYWIFGPVIGSQKL